MDSAHSSLPHHRLRAYGTALAFLRAVQDVRVRDRELRVQALRAAKSVCLNIAEGAGRVTRADKARAYTVARGELVEAIAAIEIATCDVESQRVRFWGRGGGEASPTRTATNPPASEERSRRRAPQARVPHLTATKNLKIHARNAVVPNKVRERGAQAR